MSDKRATDQRDMRHKRARDNGNALVRRATDRETLTDLEVESAVARRWNLAQGLEIRCPADRDGEGNTVIGRPPSGLYALDQLATGVREPEVKRARPSGFWGRLRGLFGRAA